jgi:hypothetical protein
MNWIDINGSPINLDHVTRVRYRKDGRDGIEVFYADGTSIRFPCGEQIISNLENLTAPVVAAAPGFYRLRCWFLEDTPPDIANVIEYRDPIIAWRVCRAPRFQRKTSVRCLVQAGFSAPGEGSPGAGMLSVTSGNWTARGRP